MEMAVIPSFYTTNNANAILSKLFSINTHALRQLWYNAQTGAFLEPGMIVQVSI
jgi:hypothetical protein